MSISYQEPAIYIRDNFCEIQGDSLTYAAGPSAARGLQRIPRGQFKNPSLKKAVFQINAHKIKIKLAICAAHLCNEL